MIGVRATLLALAGGLALVAGCSVSSTAPTSGPPSAAQLTSRVPVRTTVPTTAAPPTAAPSVHVAAAPNPCTRNRAGKLVRVSIARQHLWMCSATHLVRQTPITSGMSGPDTETPTGHFRIQGRNRDSVLTLANGRQYDVRYWIPFNAPLYGFHDSSWQHFPYGSPEYRTDGSHGCVHLPLAAIAFLYRWAAIGTQVVIA